MLALSSGEVNSLLQTISSEKIILAVNAASFDAGYHAGDENVSRKCSSDRRGRIYGFSRRRAGESSVVSARKTSDGAHSSQVFKQTAT